MRFLCQEVPIVGMFLSLEGKFYLIFHNEILIQAVDAQTDFRTGGEPTNPIETSNFTFAC